MWLLSYYYIVMTKSNIIVISCVKKAFMLINMQTKFVYVMFYNSVLNSYVVNFIILQSQGEKKLLCILSYV